MKRSMAALSVLVALAIAVAGARHELKPDARRGEQSPGPAVAETSAGDTALEQAIERARQRQAAVDGLADRLTPDAD